MTNFLAVQQREYPWMTDSDVIYLDHASTGAIPKATADAVTEYVSLRHMPFTMKPEHFFATLQKSRELVATLIGASADEIALTTNTSHGINLAAFSLPLNPGDEILTVDREFPANVFPWIKRAERTGAVLVRLPCVDDVPDQAALLEAIATRPKVKVVTVSWVSFCSGARIDIDAVGKACRERGIYFVVDAIQGLGALTARRVEDADRHPRLWGAEVVAVAVGRGVHVHPARPDHEARAGFGGLDVHARIG